MQLPALLRSAIDSETARYPQQALSRAAAELSASYRDQHPVQGTFIASEVHRAAYLGMRLPATYAATSAALAEVGRLMPGASISSLLDLGAGPGTASWATAGIFAGLSQITCLEREAAWIGMGKRLAGTGVDTPMGHAIWMQRDLRSAPSLPAGDLVVSSYALGEIEREQVSRILRQAWAAARQALVIVEPGTMAGFELIRSLRAELLALGGRLIAPCPHQGDCPIGVGDWCHFSQRIERSPLHRQLKSGTLGHEDEKFAYIAVAKEAVVPVPSRVLRHPLRHPGHTRLLLCSQEGIETVTVTRSDREQWKRVRKVDWGDAWS